MGERPAPCGRKKTTGGASPLIGGGAPFFGAAARDVWNGWQQLAESAKKVKIFVQG